MFILRFSSFSLFVFIKSDEDAAYEVSIIKLLIKIRALGHGLRCAWTASMLFSHKFSFGLQRELILFASRDLTISASVILQLGENYNQEVHRADSVGTEDHSGQSVPHFNGVWCKIEPKYQLRGMSNPRHSSQDQGSLGDRIHTQPRITRVSEKALVVDIQAISPSLI